MVFHLRKQMGYEQSFQNVVLYMYICFAPFIFDIFPVSPSKCLEKPIKFCVNTQTKDRVNFTKSLKKTS